MNIEERNKSKRASECFCAESTHNTWWVDSGKWGGRCRKGCFEVRVVGARLSESSRELGDEVKHTERNCLWPQGGWRGWTSESDHSWRTGATGRLNGDEVMQIRRLGGCKNFVGKWQQFVFDAFCYSEPVKRTQDAGDLTGLFTTARTREFWICWTRAIWDFGRLWYRELQ